MRRSPARPWCGLESFFDDWEGGMAIEEAGAADRMLVVGFGSDPTAWLKDRHRNLSRAAEELYLSQPAVSAHLKSLEAHLGRPLFVRQPRGVAPTPMGVTLASRATGPLQSLQATVRALKTGADDFDRTIYIGGPADGMSAVIVPALAPLIAQGLTVRAVTGSTKALLARLAQADLDLVVATAPSRVRGIDLTPLFTETLALVAGAGWSDRHKPADPNTLAAAPSIAYSEDLQLIRRYWRIAFGETPSFIPSVVLSDLRGALELVAAGAGWTVLPTYLAAPQFDSGRVVVIHRPDEPPTNTLYLATQRSRNDDPILKALTDRLTTAATTDW